MRTLGFGRLPRTGSGAGLKVVVGSVVVGGTPGSWAIPLNTIRHVSLQPKLAVDATSGSWYEAIPMGSSKTGYGFLNTLYMGTGAKPIGTATAKAISYVAYGE